MSPLALLAVLTAAITHATWNLYAKRAAGALHFVWLYSVCGAALYTPAAVYMFWREAPALGPLQWLALTATAVLHLAYTLGLQAGYRVADLSLLYPLARGSGPLFAFFAAALLLGERVTALSLLGVALVVAGILLVSGLTRATVHTSRQGIAYGLGIGALIAAYTVNDGWAVATLLLPPVLVDYAGTLFRALVLTPHALRRWPRAKEELRQYWRPALVVGVLGPLGYILVLYAMRVAPVSHVAPARELATLVATFYGARLLKEPVGPLRAAGAACIVAGVLSLALAPAG